MTPKENRDEAAKKIEEVYLHLLESLKGEDWNASYMRKLHEALDNVLRLKQLNL